MTDDNKQLIRRLYETVSSGDMEALGEAIADDMIEHEEMPGLEPTKEGVIEFFTYMRSAFPDLEMTADDIVGEGDLVAVRGTITGTHQGEFMGMSSSGNRITVHFADFFRIANRQIAEHWGVSDMAAMMEQLGADQS